MSQREPVSRKEIPGPDVSNDDLATQVEAIGPYHGWTFTYEYPGLFCYAHPQVPLQVFCTPDWSGMGTVQIDAQDGDGESYEEFSGEAPFQLRSRSGATFVALMGPFLDKLLSDMTRWRPEELA